MSPSMETEIATDLPNEKSLRVQGEREQWMLLSLSTPALLAVVLIIIIPVGWLFYLSFIGNDGQLSLEHYQKMIEYKSYARVFVTTFQVVRWKRNRFDRFIILFHNSLPLIAITL